MSQGPTNSGEQSFAELFEQNVKTIKEGEVVHGTVLSVDDESVQIDIGFKSEGLVPTWEFMDEDGTILIKPGDIVGAIKEAVGVTEKGSPFLLEFVVKEGRDFSRYNLPGL